MNPSLPRIVIVLGLVAALTVALIGCKQNLGERCQANDDCTSPLICNQATKTCTATSGGGLDAEVPDAPPE